MFCIVILSVPAPIPAGSSIAIQELSPILRRKENTDKAAKHKAQRAKEARATKKVEADSKTARPEKPEAQVKTRSTELDKETVKPENNSSNLEKTKVPEDTKPEFKESEIKEDTIKGGTIISDPTQDPIDKSAHTPKSISEITKSSTGHKTPSPGAVQASTSRPDPAPKGQASKTPTDAPSPAEPPSRPIRPTESNATPAAKRSDRIAAPARTVTTKTETPVKDTKVSKPVINAEEAVSRPSAGALDDVASSKTRAIASRARAAAKRKPRDNRSREREDRDRERQRGNQPSPPSTGGKRSGSSSSKKGSL